MAQIPQLERFTPSKQMPQNDRINMKVQDQGSQILANTNAIAKLGEKGTQMYEMYQADKIEQISTAAEQEYTKWNNDQLTKLKNIQGDPTEAYAQYEEAVMLKKQEMMADRQKFGENVTTALTGRLDKVISHQSIAADHQRGQQQEVYANNLFESQVKLKRDGMAVNAGYIQKGDPTSFSMFDQNVGDIKTAIAKRGFKQGTVSVLPEDAEKADHVYVDDDGKTVKVNFSPIAKARFAKDISEGVKSSLDVLITSGRIEEARELQKRYGGVLTATQAAKIESKFQNASRKTEAFKILGTLENVDDDKKLETIQNIKDPQLQSTVLQLQDRNERYMTNMRTRREKANYDSLGSYVLEKMSSSNPYLSVIDLENDPNSPYSGTWDNLSVKQKKAITEMIEAPKTSNPKSIAHVQGLFMNDDDGTPDFMEMKPHEFQAELAGLSKGDRAKFTNLYTSMATQTDGEKRALYKSAGKILKDQLIASDLINPDKYSGKLKDDDQQLMITAQENLMKYISSNPGMRDDAKILSYVKENAAQLIKKRAFSTTPAAPKNNDRKTANDGGNIKLTNAQFRDYQRQYARANNGYYPPKDDPEFEAFIKTQMKR